MSTDYFLFLDSDCVTAECVFAPLLETSGVENQQGLHITGLTDVICEPLSPKHRSVMKSEYGEFGLQVNWEIRGTHDKTTDILHVIGALFHCAAALINANPDKSLSLMRNGESIYVFNTTERLIVSPTYLEAIPTIRSLFKKPYVIDSMTY